MWIVSIFLWSRAGPTQSQLPLSHGYLKTALMDSCAVGLLARTREPVQVGAVKEQQWKQWAVFTQMHELNAFTVRVTVEG